MPACRERTDNPNESTIYSSDFTTPPALPTVRYRRFPFLTDSSKTSDPRRTFHLEEQHVPHGPHRWNSSTDVSPALGIGTLRSFKTIQWSEGKPIVRAPWPRDFVPLESAAVKDSRKSTTPAGSVTVEDIVDECAYQTTSRKAGKEYALPVPQPPVPKSAMEETTDPVSLRLQRYRTHPERWQNFSFEWDKSQLRDSTRTAAEKITLPNITETQLIAQQHAKVAQEAKQQKANLNAANSGTVAFNRPMPGYAGYLPRKPIGQKMKSGGNEIDNNMCSTSRASYRTLPGEVYIASAGGFYRKGPMSKTITLTYPYNPFKKLNEFHCNI